MSIKTSNGEKNLKAVRKNIINDYSYFPPNQKADFMEKFWEAQQEQTMQIVKEHNLDLNKDEDVKKIMILLNESMKLISWKAKWWIDMWGQFNNHEEDFANKMFYSLNPYFSLQQFVYHYYFAKSFNQVKTKEQETLGKINSKIKGLIDLDFYKKNIKSKIREWEFMTAQARFQADCRIQESCVIPEDFASFVGLMRDKPILPILGSLFDLWFYPMVSDVEKLDIDFRYFSILVTDAWIAEETMIEELENKNAETIINAIVKAKTKIKLTYPLPQIASIELREKILTENASKIENDDFGTTIFNFIKTSSKWSPRLILSINRFGLQGEERLNFINNLFQDLQDANLNRVDQEEVKMVRDQLINLKFFLQKYQEKITIAIINHQEPYYSLLTYVLEHLTIRPALPGIIYSYKVDGIMTMDKLLISALKIEIDYLETITKLPLDDFIYWFKTTRYQN